MNEIHDDDVEYGCDVCGKFTKIEPMCIDGFWHICEKCGDFDEYIQSEENRQSS